eukprot:gnl/MRDRNA2_/MRDRNA2_90313_c0_seq1.p1 gnl/MRDRNA2_/MRDRNA2_90313_c0~~gnl/MRDRNA2_/MRDRNA2_90313_c0_seq1.p1  ORF type:complete len:646 (-),score=96.40 gnl/MRDRNA2_/MRDRNA2_90313_c0_seq1:192-2129(-)
MGIQSYRARSAAAQWRTEKRPSVLAEREDRRAIFRGLEEIDNIIIGAKVHPDDSNNRSQSPPSKKSHPETKRARGHSESDQRSAAERMHSGLHSSGETVTISDQIHELTSLPRLPQPPASPASTAHSPPLTARAKKYRRILEVPNRSFLPEVSVTDTSDLAPQSWSTAMPQLVSRGDSLGLPSSACQSVSPPQSRRSSISDPSGDLSSRLSPLQESRARRRFVCQDDLFASVLTPRSRSSLPRLRTASSKSPRPGTSASPSRSSLALQQCPTPTRTSLQQSPALSRRPSFQRFQRAAADIKRLMIFKKVQSPTTSRRPSFQQSPTTSRRPSLGTCSESAFMLADEGCPSALTVQFSPQQHRNESREMEHAQKSLRLLIFGRGKPGNSKDKMKAFDDEKGTKKQHLELLDFWAQLDPEMYGEANFSDFQNLLKCLEHEAHVHHLQCQKITSWLVDRETGRVMLDDLIETIWPDLLPEENAMIWEHMVEEQEKRRRIPIDEPPLLPAEDREALERIFDDLDATNTGCVSFEALAAARDELGLLIMDPDRLKRYAAEWDIWWGPLGSEDAEIQEEQKSSGSNDRCKIRDRSGSNDRRQSTAGSRVISRKSFLLMMCPAGFQAFEGAQVTTHETGGVLVRSNSGAWHAI